jgi:hypothetical protein
MTAKHIPQRTLVAKPGIPTIGGLGLSSSSAVSRHRFGALDLDQSLGRRLPDIGRTESSIFSMSKNDTVRDLLRICMAERQKGADFPSIWNSILKRHPLVFSAPVQLLEEGEAKLAVPLITGQKLVYGAVGFSLA